MEHGIWTTSRESVSSWADGYGGYNVHIVKTKKTVQCRTHKKKRINKKWAKRYGFKEVPVEPLVPSGKILLDKKTRAIFVNEDDYWELYNARSAEKETLPAKTAGFCSCGERKN